MTTRRTTVTDVTAALTAVACSPATARACSGVGATTAARAPPTTWARPRDCVVVDMAVSPEKVDLLTDLAQRLQRVGREAERRGVSRPRQPQVVGAAASAAGQDWPTRTNGPRPVIWSPAPSAWGAILNQRLADHGDAGHGRRGRPFMLNAARDRHAAADGRGARLPRDADRLRRHPPLASDPEGWASYGHPEWGPFQLGKTNPNFSTSGLSALIAQYYAATGKTSGLTSRTSPSPTSPTSPAASSRPSSTTATSRVTFLNNWYRGRPAGHLAHLRVGGGRRGEVGHRLQLGQPRRRARTGRGAPPAQRPLVAIYPKEGTLYSDNPFYVLDAEWVDDEQSAGAELFNDFVQQPENQEQVLEYGFRPGNPEVAIGTPDRRRQRRRPRPAARRCSRCPSPRCSSACSTSGRTSASRPGCCSSIDVSGSMGELADRDTGATKLDLAKQAAITASTSSTTTTRWACGSSPPDGHRATTGGTSTSCPPADRRQREEPQRRRSRDLVPTNGTPLYTVHEAVRGGARRLRPDPDQRRRAPDRRRERRRRAPTTTSSSTSCSPPCEGSEGGRPASRSRSPTARTPTRPPCAASPRPARRATTPAIAPSTRSRGRGHQLLGACAPTPPRSPGLARRHDMATGCRFRDRFFTPPWRGPSPPLGILAAGAGAAVGILAGLGTIGAVWPSSARSPGRVAAGHPAAGADRPDRPLHAERAVAPLRQGRPAGPGAASTMPSPPARQGP